MSKNKTIIQRALDFNLDENEIQEIESNNALKKDLQVAEESDKLAKELLLPGYSNLVQYKADELAITLDKAELNEPEVQSNPKNTRILILKILSIAAVFLLVILVSGIFKSPINDKVEISKELQKIAMNSFENSGLLHNNRSDELDQNKLFVYESYHNNTLIPNDKCGTDKELCKLTNATINVKAGNYTEAITILNDVGAHIEIKNKLLLYSYYQLDDSKYLENLKIISDNLFPNHDLINSLIKNSK